MNTSTTIAAMRIAPPIAADGVERRTWIAVYAAILGVFMSVLDIQVTNASLRDILGTLSATPEEGSWMTTAYLSAEVIVISLTGFFSRVFGVRNYMLGTTLAFLVFSTLCGFAWNLPAMIVFRACQGFAGGALIPMAMMLILMRLPVQKRTLGLAWLMLSSTLGPTLGPVVGGYLTELYGWPSIFFINWLPGVFMLAGLAYGLSPEPPKLDILFSADWLSIGLTVLGLGSLIIFLEEGNTKDWFGSDFIQLFFALALFGIISSVLMLLLRDKPFVNIRLFSQRNFCVASVAGAAAAMALFGATYVLPLFLSQIAGYNAMQIGEVILWMGWPQIFLMPVAATLAKKYDNRWVCTIGLLFFSLSCFMNAYMDATTGRDQIIFSQLMRGIGQPFVILTLSNFAIYGMPMASMASASSLYNMARILGGAVGTALLATTITQREDFHSAQIGLSISDFAHYTRERLEHITQLFNVQSGDTLNASRQAILTLDHLVRREAYVMAYNDCFFILGSVLLAAIAVIWCADRVVAGGK